MRWAALTRYVDDRRLEMSNNAAARALRPLLLERKNFLFVGSEQDWRRAATIYALTETARVNGVTLKPSAPTSSPASLITRSVALTSCGR